MEVLSSASFSLPTLDPGQHSLPDRVGSHSPTNLLFVDAGIKNYQSLTQDIDSSSKVFVLDPTKDGIAQITKAISQYEEVDSVQILSHGSAGQLQLGSTSLNLETLERHQQSLQQWSKSLSADADILFYGCNLAASTEGTALVKTISHLTKADVAASTDLTGDQDQGGDWALEYHTGAIDTNPLVSKAAIDDFNDLLYTFTNSRLTPADTLDFTRFGYTYDQGYNRNFSVLPSGAAQTTGLKVRKNATTLTQAEIDAFVGAVRQLKATPVVTDNGIVTNVYDQFVAAHAAARDAQGRTRPNGQVLSNPGHGLAAFGPWHRILVAEFEKALQTVSGNPNITIPYWDWTDPAATNIIFSSSFMGPNGDSASAGRVTGGPFTRANGWTVRTDLTTGTWRGLNGNATTLTRRFGGANGTTTLGTRAQMNTTLNSTTYLNFRRALEGATGMHNNTHAWVGGMMANVTASNNDPVFWLLHANVDRIWAEWQVNNHWGPGFYPSTGQNYGHNLNDPMFPWDDGVMSIAADLQDLLPNLPTAGATIAAAGTPTTTTSTPSTGVVALSQVSTSPELMPVIDSTGTADLIIGNMNIDSNLQNTGVVSPGISIGRVKVDGNYRQKRNGELTIEIAGQKRGKEYDVLNVSGKAFLNGVLNLYFTDGFKPDTGDKFKFLTADAIKGDFRKVNVFGLTQKCGLDLVKKNGAYFLKVVDEDHKSDLKFGAATSRKALQNDKRGNLYNPAFGECLTEGHFLYESKDHKTWGKNASDMHGHHDSDWFMPLDVNMSKVLRDVANGKDIPDELCCVDDQNHDHKHGDDHDHEQKNKKNNKHDHGSHDHGSHDHSDHDHSEHDHSEHDHSDHEHKESKDRKHDDMEHTHGKKKKKHNV